MNPLAVPDSQDLEPQAPDPREKTPLKPGDATSEEGAGALVALVGELRASGSYHPFVLVGRGALEQPVAVLGRTLVVALGGTLGIFLLGQTTPGYRELGLVAWVLLGAPLWSVLLVGAWRDTLEGSRSLRIRDQLDRWGLVLLRAVPAAVVHVLALWGSTVLVWVGLLDSPLEAWRGSLVALAYLGLALSWWLTACSLVLREAGVLRSLWHGPSRALTLLLRAPLDLPRWLLHPTRSGTRAILPLLLFLGVAVFLGGIGGALGGVLLGTTLARVFFLLVPVGAFLGTLLGLELGVGVGVLNQLAVLAEEAGTAPVEVLPEGQMSGEGRLPGGGPLPGPVPGP